MLPEFLAVASAALVLQKRRFASLPRPGPLVLDVMFVAGLALTGLWCWNIILKLGGYWQGHWTMLLAPVVIGVLLAISVLAAFWGSRLGRLLLANRPVYFLGLISYSLYLWHYVVLQQLELVFGATYAGLTGLPRFLLTFAAVVLVSTASYFLVERPFFRLPGRKRRGLATSASGSPERH